ncbi:MULTISPECIES: cation transporter [Eubacteriales]|uniref:heavy-metal-associated domain-containing protein n=1 Tax=Eubacteriales TaxID=186802 RepID=UPI00068133F8|nr:MULTISPECIES: cation transporter [Eubacteriales]
MFGKTKKDVTLSILGMHCEHCAANLERALLAADGVKKAKVSFANKAAEVTYDESKIDLSGISNVVSEAGYQLGD